MYPAEMFDKEMVDEEKHAACIAKLDEHFKTCAQCSLEDARDQKKRATAVRLNSLQISKISVSAVSNLIQHERTSP
jgi:hypothetical protein